MTGHFKTLDGCERWQPNLSEPHAEMYKIPYSVHVAYDSSYPLSSARQSYDYRLYKLESIDYRVGMLHYVEVYRG